MKKTRNVRLGKNALLGFLSLMLVLTLAFATEMFSMVTYAQSAGKVTASSANIREKADSGSTVLGSAQRDAELTINGKTTDASGNTWYQVFVDADTLGFIRSDLVQITDGSTPATLSGSGNSSNSNANSNTGSTTNQNTNSNETPAEVTAVNPVSGTITGGQNVRVRANASTTSEIKTTAQNGMALTVVGKATGSDNREWYQVKFAVDGSEILGFVRSDYVNLSGELTEYVEEQVPTENEKPEENAEENKEVELTKDWETQLQGEDWYLIDNKAAGQYKISDMFSAVENNSKLYLQEKDTNKTLKGAVIALVIVIILMAAGIAYLIFKLKDMSDLVYFAEAERALLGKKTADRPQGGQSKSGSKGESGTKTAQGTVARPQGQRPAGSTEGRPVQGNRPQGQRPVRNPEGRPVQGSRPQGQRPVGNPEGRPVQGARPQGQRPVGNPEGRPVQGARPQGQRPAGAQGTSEGRPVQVARPAQPVQNSAQNTAAKQDPNWKSRNFMADDDEFEFEFLNWDGEEE